MIIPPQGRPLFYSTAAAKRHVIGGELDGFIASGTNKNQAKKPRPRREYLLFVKAKRATIVAELGRSSSAMGGDDEAFSFSSYSFLERFARRAEELWKAASPEEKAIYKTIQRKQFGVY